MSCGIAQVPPGEDVAAAILRENAQTEQQPHLGHHHVLRAFASPCVLSGGQSSPTPPLPSSHTSVIFLRSDGHVLVLAADPNSDCAAIFAAMFMVSERPCERKKDPRIHISRKIYLSELLELVFTGFAGAFQIMSHPSVYCGRPRVRGQGGSMSRWR